MVKQNTILLLHVRKKHTTNKHHTYHKLTTETRSIEGNLQLTQFSKCLLHRKMSRGIQMQWPEKIEMEIQLSKTLCPYPSLELAWSNILMLCEIK